MTAMRPETTSEHIARDMREGRLPERSEPQMVADPTGTAPERIWLQDGGDFDAASEVTWCQHSIDDADTEYVRADLAAVQPPQVRVRPLAWEEDEHGNFRAQSVRGGEGVDRMIEPQVIGDDRVTYEAWGIKDSFDDPVAAMSAVEAEISAEILAALEPQPDPRDEQRRALEKVIRNQRVQIKRLAATAEAHWRFVNRVREERLADPRDEVIKGLGPIADLLPDAVTAAEKAMRKYPQPNYVISKWAEETGEVTKDLIHMAEGRQTVEKLRGEIVQSLAMLHRLLVEGDQVHGLPPIAAALAAAKVVQHG